MASDITFDKLLLSIQYHFVSVFIDNYNSSLYKVRSQNFEINQMVEFSVVEFSELTSQSVN